MVTVQRLRARGRSRVTGHGRCWKSRRAAGRWPRTRDRPGLGHIACDDEEAHPACSGRGANGTNGGQRQRSQPRRQEGASLCFPSLLSKGKMFLSKKEHRARLRRAGPRPGPVRLPPAEPEAVRTGPRRGPSPSLPALLPSGRVPPGRASSRRPRLSRGTPLRPRRSPLCFSSSARGPYEPAEMTTRRPHASPSPAASVCRATDRPHPGHRAPPATAHPWPPRTPGHVLAHGKPHGRLRFTLAPRRGPVGRLHVFGP